MKLNYLEFLAMNNPIRAYIQEKYELPILMKMLGSRNFESVLEIGCGNGNGTRLIRKYFNPLHITAVDLDERMIRIAQRKVKDTATDFRVMDASKLDFPKGSFDAVFDFGIIHHIPNWKSCLEELRRVLKDGGKLVLEDISIESFRGFPGGLYRLLSAHPYRQMFSTEGFTAYLEEVGFRIIQFKKFNPLKMIRFFSLVAEVG